MFRHVALLRFTDDATREQRVAVLDGLAALPAAIPEIRTYDFGVDAGVDAGNFDLAIVADFDDATAYATYRDHPAHRDLIATRVRPVLADRAAVQFRVP